MVKKASSILGCIRKSFTSRLREVILPSIQSYDTNLECWVQVRAPQYQRELDLLEHVKCRAVKMMKVLEHLWDELRLRELGLFSLEKRRLREILLMYINT